MRKKIVIAGIIIIIIGIALYGIGYHEATTLEHKNLREIGSNEFATPNITLKAGWVFAALNSPSDSGLVCSSNLSNVKESTIENYSITPTKETGGNMVYEITNQTTGTYVFVLFGSHSKFVYDYGNPNTIIFWGNATLDFFGAGEFLIFIGVIVAIVGLILKKKPGKVDETDNLEQSQDEIK